MIPRATEGQTQLVFRRIDPLLQALLPSVSRHQQYVERNDSDPALFIQLIQSQVKILENLQEVILQLGPPFAPTMIVLADYISLPLNAILHIPAPHSTTTTKDKEILLRSQILFSHIRTLHRATAKTIQSYVQTCCSQEQNEEALPVRLKDSHLVKFLVALTNVLPSSSLLENDSISLDEGTETWLALLDAIKDIVRVCSDDEIYNQWDGKLIVRLADCASSMALSDNYKLSLESMETLDSLLLKVRKSHLWQSIFPGVFASLYRRFITMNRQTPSGLSIAIETKCLRVIQVLLVVTLEPLNKQDSHKVERSALDMLQQLAIASSNGSTTKSQEKTEESTFLRELKTRVANPLSFLLRQGVVSSSATVRVQVASLCQILLEDTAECWTSTTLPELALNTCLILQTDPQELVADHAKKIIQEMRKFQAGSADHSWMIPRIQALVEETTVLAQGAKQVELQTQLQLIIGYIQTVGSDGSAALAACTGMHKSLVALADIDLDSAISKGPAIDMDKRKKESQLRFRRLTGDLTSLTRKMLRTLGTALGSKHGSILVDRLVSDFYESSLQHLSYFVDFQEVFFHQWIGSVVVSQEIMKGAFSETIEASPKEKKRRHRILESLASSILPLLVDSSLWNVRTKQPSQGPEAPPRNGTGNKRPLVAKELYGNTCVLALLLELVSSIFQLLGKDVGSLLPIMLFPIIEKASRDNELLVQRAAHQSIVTLAEECGFSGLNSLIRHEFNPLVAAMFGRLRLPGGMFVPADGDLQDTLSLLASITWVLEVANTTDSDQPCGAEEAKTTSLIDLVSLLEDRYDHFALRKLLSEENTHDLLVVHQLCFDFLNMTVGANDRSIYSFPTDGGSAKSEPWLDLLSHFRKPTLSGFQESAPEKQDTMREKHAALDIGIGEIGFVSKLITKDCYLLSNKSLMVQVSACGSLTSGYRLLAFVSCNYEDADDEQNTIKNSILRQAASSWPSIKARLHNVMDEVIGSKIMSISLILRATDPTASSQDVATKRFFLAKIFTLIATMCECGGEFMANRFKNDVWPVTARFLGRILERAIGKESKKILPVRIQREDENLRKSVSNLSDSERHLMLAAFDCLGRVFFILDLPESLMAAAASTLLPFLDSSYYGKGIGETSMETLKKLAEKNYDVLCRPLLQLSGRGIPACPLIPKKDNQISATISAQSEPSELGVKANELLSYIESLPEQIID